MFTLTSAAFRNGTTIPVRYTCDGDNTSPPLAWNDRPDGTKSYALIVDDPDAPARTFTHWLLSDIAGDCTELPEGAARPGGGVAGRNDFASTGYGGPCPPKGHGPHRYRFHLHALNRRLGLKPGYSRSDLEAALRDHVLGTARLEGVYERRR
jgi:Raf kinase inhibitor-like YbhB/YbcL family protein